MNGAPHICSATATRVQHPANVHPTSMSRVSTTASTFLKRLNQTRAPNNLTDHHASFAYYCNHTAIMPPPQSLVVSLISQRCASATNTRQNKLKVQLKLSISRLRMLQQKDSAKAKQQRREMAQLLEVRRPCQHYCAQAITHTHTCSHHHAGRQSPIRTNTRRKHNPLRHHHRTPRDPRTLLRTPPRALPTPRIASILFKHHLRIHLHSPRPRARRSRSQHNIRRAANRDQGTAYREGAVGG